MIRNWLEAEPRPSSNYSFGITDINETTPPTPPTASELASLMREEYWGESYIAELAERYGMDNVKERLLEVRSGARLSVRRGDFGEALSAQFLSEIEGYAVPVKKLRYKATANQLLLGTDCIGIKMIDEEISEICFIEAKLRTTFDVSVAVDGYKQLEKDYESVTPEILTFIARRLNDAGDPLAGAFESYIFSRNVDLDTFKLLIFHEHRTWNERILQNLEDEGVEIGPFTAYAAKIHDLALLSDATFNELGVTEVFEDD